MGRKLSYLGMCLLLGFSQPAVAGDLTAIVIDEAGRAVENAVVMLVPEMKAAMPDAASRLASEKIIDQRNETFLPSVTIIPKGGRIVFTNSDQTTHQVYSFSPTKQFEITLTRGEKSPPLAFDKTGVAALGCNIHDHMIAYAFVAESPWTALTGKDGKAVIPDTPPGKYRAQVWHPKFPPGRPLPSLAAAMSGDNAQLSITVKVAPAPIRTRGHAGSY